MGTNAEDFISPEMRKQIDEQNNAMLQMRMAEYSKEYNRFKQDCRKRALDLAHNELDQLMRADKGAEFSVTETADKYYNWLITIPESK